jgi:type IV pilus assembly protein PilQ
MQYVKVVFVMFLTVFAMEAKSFASTATIGSIKLAPNGSRIEIQGDQPLTYLYRKMTGGGGILLDIAPGKTRGIVGEIPGVGHITGIWVKELQVDGVPVTRLVIGMDKDAVVNVSRDAADSGRLLVTFPSLASPDATVPGDPALTDLLEPQIKTVAEPVELQKPKLPASKTVASVSSPSIAPELKSVPNAEIIPEVKPGQLPVVVAPAAPARDIEIITPSSTDRPVLGSIVINRDTIELLTGSSMPPYDSFKLSSPERLVVDIPGAGISLKSREIKVGKFGVSKVRVGVYADKVRLVFDAESKEGVPMHIIQKTPKGLKITFASVGSKK